MNRTPQDIAALEEKAREIRMMIIDMLHRAGSGHPGGSLSAVDILTVLYYDRMKADGSDPKDPDRDRFILSKGHACPAVYAVLADRGYFPREELNTLRTFGSRLQGHPDSKKVPGIEIASGSLGMGISFGIGTALGARANKKSYHTYVLTGDGEMDEGQNWEAFMCAVKYGLDNLTVIVDHNKVQLDGTNDEILPLGDLGVKLRDFGWHVIRCNGHDIRDLLAALDDANRAEGVPTVIIADTVKGKGVSFMEGKAGWHGKTVDDEAFDKAMAELGGDR